MTPLPKAKVKEVHSKRNNLSHETINQDNTNTYMFRLVGTILTMNVTSHHDFHAPCHLPQAIVYSL